MAESTRNAEADEKILERARKRWKIADEAEEENRTKQVDDLKFLAASPDDPWQWPQTVLNKRLDSNQEGGPRPCLTINKLPQHHRQVTNEQRMNRPQIKVRPVDDKADPKVAKIYDGLFRHIQVASEAGLAYDTACDLQVGAGEGYFRLYTEYCDERSFDQEIVIGLIADRFKVYMDPIGLLQHPAGKKCQWGFIIEDVPKDEYEDQYGDENVIDWSDAGTGDQLDWFPNKETVRIAEYFEIEKKPATLLGWASGAVSVEGEPTPEGVVMGEQPIRTRKTKLPKCIWRKINGQHVLDEREMPTKYIPIVRVVGNQWIIEGKPVVSGLTRNAKDAQRMYNYNASMEVEMNALAPKAPFVGMASRSRATRTSGAREPRVVRLPHTTLVYNDRPATSSRYRALAHAQPAMPQAAIITAKLSAADDIKSTMGSTTRAWATTRSRSPASLCSASR
jgi:hypothetical protein